MTLGTVVIHGWFCPSWKLDCYNNNNNNNNNNIVNFLLLFSQVTHINCELQTAVDCYACPATLHNNQGINVSRYGGLLVVAANILVNNNTTYLSILGHLCLLLHLIC